MAIKLKRGTEATIPTLQVGEPGFTTDSKKLFIGSDAGNIEIGGDGLLSDLLLKENKSEKGIANGYASLDSGAKIPSSQLPDSILGQLEYKGTFNPSNGYPVSPEKGWYYISIGNAAISGADYKVGDWAVYNGASWDKIDNTETTALVKVTWQELKNKRDADELIPGQQYRITNYITTTAQTNTQSAGHQFDIIVTADDVNKLNENARACLHAGDTYFANSKLEAWKLKYCLDNDTNRFAWADEVNGKGIIYRMIDEFNNDCPYDFKNIQFSKSATWHYTFADDLIGASYNNKIENYSAFGSTAFVLSFNTFGNSCYSNTFGNGCHDNTFSNGCHDNTFSNGCFSNTFGSNCQSNTFGANCNSNTFGDGFRFNTFGNNCSSSTFENDCFSNTFGADCIVNTFGSNCQSNTFGYNCRYNTFSDSCSRNTFGNYCRYLTINDNTSTEKKYIHVENGTQGISAVNKFDLYDSAISNKNYQVTFKKGADGSYVMTWLDDYDMLEGKYKESNLDTTWKNLPHDIDGGAW